MKFTVDGVTYERVENDRLTYAEQDAIERAIGMTMAEVDRKSMTCVCDHFAAGHLHPDDEEDQSCTQCDCPGFSPVVPRRVYTAGLWVSMKRSDPTLTFEQAGALCEESLTVEDEEPPKDQPAASPTDGTSTSPTSPTSSDSIPGTSTG